jgi:sulfur-carrier protein adenylyltransferase/sulfurtransferase
MFDYNVAFSRNIGWLTLDEQQKIKHSRIAIAGLGGVGGQHLLTLVRLGVQNFHLADFDDFACENTNRQAGAMLSTYDCSKLDTMVAMAKDINPNVSITPFPKGINEENIDAFLQDVDCYVDALDFYVLPVRRMVFSACHKKGIPAITAAPVGMGTAYLNFSPKGISFDTYFCLNDQLDMKTQYLRFMVGLAPMALHRKALVDPSSVDLKEEKGPSTTMGCLLASGVIGSEVFKILLSRGTVHWAPVVQQFDAYTNRFKRKRIIGGNKHPLQRLKCWFLSKTL